MTRVYIAGPMSGLPEFNYPAFHAAAEKLRGMGFHVENPAEINSDPATPWAQCMRADIARLEEPAVGEDGAIVLPALLAMAGIYLLGDHYPLNTALDPVRLVTAG